MPQLSGKSRKRVSPSLTRGSIRRRGVGSGVVNRILEFRESYNMTVAEIADVLDVTPKTMTRITQSKKKDNEVSLQKADSLEVLRSIFELGKSVLGSKDSVTQWLRSPVFSLAGQKPIDLIKTESGRRKVETALHQIENGIY